MQDISKNTKESEMNNESFQKTIVHFCSILIILILTMMNNKVKNVFYPEIVEGKVFLIFCTLQYLLSGKWFIIKQYMHSSK